MALRFWVFSVPGKGAGSLGASGAHSGSASALSSESESESESGPAPAFAPRRGTTTKQSPQKPTASRTGRAQGASVAAPSLFSGEMIGDMRGGNEDGRFARGTMYSSTDMQASRNRTMGPFASVASAPRLDTDSVRIRVSTASRAPEGRGPSRYGEGGQEDEEAAVGTEAEAGVQPATGSRPERPQSAANQHDSSEGCCGRCCALPVRALSWAMGCVGIRHRAVAPWAGRCLVAVMVWCLVLVGAVVIGTAHEHKWFVVAGAGAAVSAQTIYLVLFLLANVVAARYFKLNVGKRSHKRGSRVPVPVKLKSPPGIFVAIMTIALVTGLALMGFALTLALLVENGVLDTAHLLVAVGTLVFIMAVSILDTVLVLRLDSNGARGAGKVMGHMPLFLVGPLGRSFALTEFKGPPES